MHTPSRAPDDCRSRRAAIGASRAELARVALVDISTIARLERGMPVSRLTRARIASALQRLEENDC